MIIIIFIRKTIWQISCNSILRKNNVKVISAKESISERAEGIILESMLEGMAEYYSVELAEKVNAV